MMTCIGCRACCSTTKAQPQPSLLFLGTDCIQAHRYGNRLIQMEQGRIARDLDAAARQKLKLDEMVSWFG